MERPHYRRQSVPGRPMNQHKKNIDISETFLRQCIVCGIVFSIILIFNLIDTDLTQGIRNDLSSALSESTTLDDIKLAFDKGAETLNGVGTSVKTIMGGAPTDTDTIDLQTDTTYSSEQPHNTESVVEDPLHEDEAVETFNQSKPEFRIDEDILEEINSRTSGEIIR